MYLEFHVGRRLAFLRMKAKISQDSLSEKLYLYRSEISKIEHGKRKISKSIANSLEKIFFLDASFFLTEEIDEKLVEIIEKFSHLIFIGRLDEAKKLVHLLSRPIKCFQQEVEVKILLSAYYYKTHLYSSAIVFEEEFLNSVLNGIQVKNFSLDLQKYHYLYLSGKYLYQANYEELVKNYITFLPTVSNEKEKLSIELNLVYAYVLLNKTETAFLQIQTVIYQLKQLNDVHLLAQGYSYLYLVYKRLNLIESALATLDILEDFSLEHKLYERLAMTYQNKGMIYSELYDYRKSLIYHKKSLDFVKSHHRQGLLLISIIKNHLLLEEIYEAKSYLAFTKNIEFTEDEKMTITFFKGQIAYYDGSEMPYNEFVAQSIDYFQKNNSTRELAYIYDYLRKIYAQNKNFEKAYYYYFKKDGLIK